MADDVNITIGGTVDDLEAAFDNAKSMAENFASNLESHFSQAAGLIESVSTKLGYLGVAFAAVSTAMNYLAINTAQNVAALKTLSTQTGFSMDQLQRWSQVADNDGVSMNALTSAFKHLELGGKDVVEGLKDLGLSFDQLKTQDMATRFETVHDKLDEVKNSFEKAKIEALVFGDALKPEQLEAVGDSFAENAAKVDVLSKAEIKAVTDLKDAWEKLNDSVSLDTKHLQAALAPFFTWGIEKLQTLADKAKSLTTSFVNMVAQTMGGSTSALSFGSFGSSASSSEEEDSERLKDAQITNYDQIARAAMISAMARVRVANMEFEETTEKIKMAALQSGLAEGQKTAALIAAVNQRKAAEEAALAEGMKNLDKSSIEYAHLAARKLEIEQQTTLELLKIQEQEVQQESAIRAEAAQNQIRLADTAYQQIVEKVNTAAQVFGMKENEKTSYLVSAVQQRLSAELTAINTEMSYLDQASAAYKKLQDQKVQLESKSNTDILKLGAEMMSEQEKQWISMADTISGAFTGQLRALIAGTETWKVAMSKIASDLIMDMIGYYVKLAAEWAAKQAYMLVVQQTTQASMAATAIAAQTAGAPVKAAAFTSQITADAAEAFAGVYAFLSPVMGPAASGPAAAAQAQVLAELANVPKLAVGMDYVPQDMLAYLHQGERVTPAEENSPTGAGGSGGGVTVNISAMDSQSVASALMNNRSSLSLVLRNLQRSNPGALTQAIMRG